MKAFLVGLLFLICIGLFALMLIILTPVLAVLNIFLYLILLLSASVLIVWILGKIILWGWGELKK